MTLSSIPSTAKVNDLIKKHAQEGRWCDVLGVLRRIQVLAAVPSAVTFGLAAGGLRSAASWEHAVRVLRCLPQYSIERNIVLRNNEIKAARDWRIACQLLRGLASEGLEPTIVSYTSASDMLAADAVAAWPLTLELLRSCWRGFVQPNAVSCSVCLSGLKPASLWQRAANTFVAMSSLGLAVNRLCLSALMSVAACGMPWLLAVAAFRHAGREGLVPDVINYWALVKLCDGDVEKRAWQPALSILQLVAGWQLEPGGTDYTPVLTLPDGNWRAAVALLVMSYQRSLAGLVNFNACLGSCKDGGWHMAVTTFDEMRRSCGLRSDVVSAGALAAAYDVYSLWRRSASLACELQCSAARPNSICINAMVKACGAAQWQQSWCLVAEMRSLLLEASDVTCNLLLSGCEKLWNWERSEGLLDKLLVSGSSGDSVACNAVASGQGKCGEWKRVANVLASMRQRRVAATVVTCGSALEACDDIGLWPLAVHLLALASKDALSLNDICCNAALRACAKERQWTWTECIFSSMQGRELRPDVLALGAAAAAAEGQCEPSLLLERLEDIFSRCSRCKYTG
eukprot:TRINITY_DN34060_c1_g1_i1.p1 TRINITY_DN34060_c1_g1~~TRINITY_DN34060_c1_g1_i1.p1  ORF type:complete len:570 (-),score=102.94 TRINITY_DN34060_c1_g1_i1:83-1792(-)